MADKQSKFFRVAVEGATCDGREIQKQDILDIVETFSPVTYGARANVEHYRNLSADGPFPCLGDVLAVKAEPFTFPLGGKDVTKLALYAQIKPNDEGLRINAKNQKIYTSIEINPNFGETKKAYLQGLAFTDNPASLGTEMLKFAAGQGDASPFAARKAHPGNFFSTALETTVEFEDAPATADDEGGKLMKLATDFFSKFSSKAEALKEEPKQAPANDNDARFAEMAQGITELSTAFSKSLTDAVAEIKGSVTQLSTKVGTIEKALENTDANSFSRKPNSGGSGRVKAAF